MIRSLVMYPSVPGPEYFDDARALPFDKLLDLLVKANLQEARQIEQNKDEILALWNSCIKKEQAK